MIDIEKNYQNTISQIDQILKTNPTSNQKLEIIAVTKEQSVDDIQKIISLGHRSFGENQIQEVELKWPQLKLKYQDIKLHFIGAIQSRKMKSICQYCDVIHSIDREKLIKKIVEIRDTGINIPELFLQVNIGFESQKSGLTPNEVEDFLNMAKDEYGITIQGLMCIPPVGNESKNYFDQLSKIAKKNNIIKLSMGMSSDFEVAIQQGATHVRIGTSIFGTRN